MVTFAERVYLQRAVLSRMTSTSGYQGRKQGENTYPAKWGNAFAMAARNRMGTVYNAEIDAASLEIQRGVFAYCATPKAMTDQIRKAGGCK